MIDPRKSPGAAAVVANDLPTYRSLSRSTVRASGLRTARVPYRSSPRRWRPRGRSRRSPRASRSPRESCATDGTSGSRTRGNCTVLKLGPTGAVLQTVSVGHRGDANLPVTFDGTTSSSANPLEGLHVVRVSDGVAEARVEVAYGAPCAAAFDGERILILGQGDPSRGFPPTLSLLRASDLLADRRPGALGSLSPGRGERRPRVLDHHGDGRRLCGRAALETTSGRETTEEIAGDTSRSPRRVCRRRGATCRGPVRPIHRRITRALSLCASRCITSALPPAPRATTYSPGGAVTRAGKTSRVRLEGRLTRPSRAHRGARRSGSGGRREANRPSRAKPHSAAGRSESSADGSDVWVASGANVFRVRASDGRLLDTWTGATQGGYCVLVAMGRVFVGGGDRAGTLHARPGVASGSGHGGGERTRPYRLQHQL